MPDAYTRIPKPVGQQTAVISKGMATGLIMPPTYATNQSITTDPYIRVPKPANPTYTKVAKPIT